MSSHLDSFLQPQQINVLLDDVFDGLIVTDSRGEVLYTNSVAQNLFGFGHLDLTERKRLNMLRYSRETFDFSTVDGEAVEEGDQPLSRALQGETYKDVELWVRPKERREGRIFSFSGTRLDGEPPLSVLTIRDVTNERKAQMRYRIAFEANPAPTLVSRLTDDVIVDLNQGFEDVTGLSLREAKGLSIMGLGLLPERNDLREVIDGLKEGRFVHGRQTTIKRGDREKRNVLVSARPIEIEGEACGIFTFVDVTELHEARALIEQRAVELEDLNAQLHAFNFSVSHDLRTPLRSIHSFAQVLLEEYGGLLDERGNGYLDRVMAGAGRLDKLLDALLWMSHVTRGPMQLGPVSLSKIAEETAAMLQASRPERRVDFQIVEGLVVQGDEQLLRAAIVSLLQNAWKFTGGNNSARIEVGSEHRGDDVVFFVRDNGAGFDMSYAGKLFEPFQRLHRQEEYEGQGIGLAAVHRIISRHGGTIWGQGSVGEGAVFYFTLPAADSSSS